MFALLLAITISDAANAGRQAMRAGDLPAAVLTFRQGLQEHPADPLVKADLDTARRLVSYPDEAMSPMPLTNWRHRISERDLFIAFTLMVIIFAVFVWKQFTTKPRWSLPGLIASTLLLSGTAVSAYAIHRENDQDRKHSIAVVKTAGMLREGNGESYAAVFSSPLPAGTELAILHRRGGWVQVRLPRGTPGWLPEAAVIE